MNLNEIGFPNMVLFEDGTVINATTGRIRSHSIEYNKYKNKDGEKVDSDYPRCRVHLSYMDHRQTWTVARLLMKYFRADEYNAHPEYDVDHIDRNSLNNDLNNLRMVPARGVIQSQNRGTYKNNTSGHKGVMYDKTNKLWVYRKMWDGKFIAYKKFKEKKDAITFKKIFEKDLHADCLEGDEC